LKQVLLKVVVVVLAVWKVVDGRVVECGTSGIDSTSSSEVELAKNNLVGEKVVLPPFVNDVFLVWVILVPKARWQGRTIKQDALCGAR
jgi:hypothetical protein